MDLFDPNDATEEEQQKALAAALRRQQAFGVIGQLSGDPVLSGVGRSLFSGAETGEQRLETQKNRRLQLKLEAKKDAETQQWRQDQAAEHKQEFGLRLADSRAQRQMMADLRAQHESAKKDAADLKEKDKLFSPFAADFDSSKGRSSLDVKSEAQLRRAEELETLLHSPGPMTPQKVEEATSMAAFIANGGNVPTVEQIRGMKPHTFRGELADWYQYASGHPTDAGVQEFMAQLGSQSERAKKTGSAQMLRSFLKKVSGHPDVMRLYKEDAENKLRAVGIAPDMYDPKTFQPTYDPVADAMAESALTPEQEEALRWARGNKENPKAGAILKALGVSR